MPKYINDKSLFDFELVIEESLGRLLCHVCLIDCNVFLFVCTVLESHFNSDLK